MTDHGGEVRERLSNNQRFYYFYQVLEKYSGEENSLTAEEISEHMKKITGEGINRKTIYRYVKELNEIGFDVSAYEENGVGYYLRGRSLEEYELRILIDAVSSSKFITPKKTEELVDKICSLHNNYVGYSLKKSVYIANRSKSRNEEVYYNIDKLSRAIEECKKVSFHYYDYDHERNLTPKRNRDGKIRTTIANPLGLFLKDEYYYVVGNIEWFDNLANYRIDRMKNIVILEDEQKPLSEIEGCRHGFDLVKYAKKSFKMFTGTDTKVVLEVSRGILSFLIDELGEDVILEAIGDGRYRATFSAKDGEGLAKWILQLGEEAKVIEPESLKEKIKEKLKILQNLYGVS